MNGKIINGKSIEGEDGNLYNFEISQLDGAKESDDLSGIVVTFTPNGLNATDIKIAGAIDGVVSLEKASNTNSPIKSIKTKAYAGMIAGVLTVIPLIGWIFGIAMIVITYIMVKEIKLQTSSQKILYNWVMSMVIVLIAVIGILIIIALVFVSENVLWQTFMGIVLLIGLGLLFVALIIGLIYEYRYYKELSYVTQRDEFKWIFWLYVAYIFANIFIQILALVIALVCAALYIYAWVKTTSLIQSSNEFDGKKSKIKE